jgi:phosphatidylglycerophosphate synthase
VVDPRRIGQQISAKVSPLARLSFRVGLTPNIITAISFAAAFVSAVFYADSNLFLGSTFLLVNLLLDILDGMVARESGMKRAWGALLDKIVDRYSWILALTGLMIAGLADPFWVSLAVFSALIRNFISLKTAVEGYQYTGFWSITVGIRPLILLGAIFSIINPLLIISVMANQIFTVAQMIISAKGLRDRPASTSDST